MRALGSRADRGTVWLALIIDPFGAVRFKEVVMSEAGYQFTLDVLAAIDRCVFSPAKKGEDLVWVRMEVPVTFDPIHPPEPTAPT